MADFALLYNNKIVSSILSPGNLIMPVEQKLFLTPADRIQTGFIHSEIDEIPFSALGSSFTQGKVVLLGAPRVAVPFDPDPDL